MNNKSLIKKAAGAVADSLRRLADPRWSPFRFPELVPIRVRPNSGSDSRSARPSRKVLRNQRGQASVEYILVLFLMFMVSGKFGRFVIDTLDRGILNVGGKLEKQLKTGRVSLNTWTN